MIQVIAATSAASATANFTQALDTAAIVVGILTTMGMMLVFVYKNRMLSLENKAEIERERSSRMEEIERERTARLSLERDVTALKVELARLKGELGVRS